MKEPVSNDFGRNGRPTCPNCEKDVHVHALDDLSASGWKSAAENLHCEQCEMSWEQIYYLEPWHVQDVEQGGGEDL